MTLPTTAREARRMLAGSTIWLWHYLHADWQWEQSRAWHEERYALAVNEVLDLMRHDAEVTYFFDTVSEFFEPVARRLGPRLDELRERVREGRIRIVSAQVANARPNQVGDETYVRNLQLGRAFFEATLPPTDLSQFHSVDIAIGHTQMPQILRLAGFQYYRAWRPHGPMNALGIPHQFFWEGLDGSRILVTRGAYGGLWLREHVPADFATDWDGAVVTLFDHMFRDQVLHDRSPSAQLWMIQGSDDARPLRTWEGDREIDLRGFLAEWRRREEIPIRWCTPLEFSQAVAAHPDRLRVVQGVLDGCDCGYNVANGGANGLWAWRQLNDRRLLRAEWWAAAAVSIGFSTPLEQFQRLWRQHLTYQAHASEFSFRDDLAHLLNLAVDVKVTAERIEQAALDAIVAAGGGGDRATQYIFNPSPRPVEADVELYHPCATAGIEALEVVDEDGRALPQQVLGEFRHPRYAGSLNDGRILVRAALPPLGYTRVHVVEKAERRATDDAAPETEGTNDVLDVGHLRLVFRDHALREAHDLQSGVIYRSPDGSPWPRLVFHVLDHQNWLFAGPEVRREPFLPERSEWIETGPLRWRHRSRGVVGPYRAQVDIVVGDMRREVQVAVRLEGHWDSAPLTGFVTLLATVGTDGQITVDIPFGVEPRDPDHEIYANNAPQDPGLGMTEMFERLRPGFFWGRSWADWSVQNHGVTLISADGNYYWLRDAGDVGHVLLRCLDRVPGTWEESCADALTGSGVHRFTYAVRFHDGSWTEADPQKRAAELRHPPRAVRAAGAGQALLPASHSFVTLTDPAILSAYYCQGDDVFVRLYDGTGRGGEATVALDWAPVSVDAVDLLGQPFPAPLVLTGRQVRVGLQPWQIITLKLARQRSAS